MLVENLHELISPPAVTGAYVLEIRKNIITRCFACVHYFSLWRNNSTFCPKKKNQKIPRSHVTLSTFLV